MFHGAIQKIKVASFLLAHPVYRVVYKKWHIYILGGVPFS